MIASPSWYLTQKPFESWAYVENFLTPEECEQVKDISTKHIRLKGAVDNKGLNKDIRDSNVTFFNSSAQEDQWIYKKITDAITSVNSNFWNFALEYIEVLQFTEYNQVGHKYSAHIDMGNNFIHYRKLSFTIQLDDPESYTGGDLLVLTSKTPQMTNKKQGTLIIFPSFILHEVTPIESGSRSSLVGWICGPNFK